MKKLVVASILACALAGSVYGQGTVTFRNTTATLVTFSDQAKAALNTTAVGPSGPSFLAELYYAPDGADPGEAGMQQGRMGAAVGFSTLAAGTFNGGNRTTPSSTPAGANAWFQVRVWEAAYGNTYETAIEAPATGGRVAIAGASNRFLLQTGTLTPTPIASVGGLAPMSVTPVPEPSAIALGLLGLVGFFTLRRRS